MQKKEPIKYLAQGLIKINWVNDLNLVIWINASYPSNIVIIESILQ